MNETESVGADRELGGDERRVLALAATGLMTDEVAARLGMSPNDARRHLARAIDALGAGSKLHAVVIAFRRGLIDLPNDGR